SNVSANVVATVQSGAHLTTNRLDIASANLGVANIASVTVTGANSFWSVPVGPVTIGAAGATVGTAAVLNVNAAGTFTEGSPSGIVTFVPAQIGSGNFVINDAGVLN